MVKARMRDTEEDSRDKGGKVEKHRINDCGVITDPEEIIFTIGLTIFRIRYAKLADGLYLKAYSVLTPRCGTGCGVSIYDEKYKTLEEALRSALNGIERYCMRNGLRCNGLREKAYGLFSIDLF